MKTSKIFKDDIGVTFKIYAGIDISSASSLVFKVKKPSSTEVSWTATLDPANNYNAIYTSVTSDFNEVGIYLLSLQVTFAGGELHTGESAEFQVYNIFEDIDE